VAQIIPLTFGKLCAIIISKGDDFMYKNISVKMRIVILLNRIVSKMLVKEVEKNERIKKIEC